MTIQAKAPASRLAAVDFASVAFSSVFSDHMLTAVFEDGQWAPAQVRPWQPLEVTPSISAFQQGFSVFEGLKAHRAPDGGLLLFRPSDHARRLRRSAARLVMADVPDALFLGGLTELLRKDAAWVPPAGLGALYIRPFLFSEDPSVRVRPGERFRFVIFTFPFGQYYSAPVDVMASERYARAFPGGTGDVKAAGNYAAAALGEREAREAGFDTVMWLDGVEHRYVEECGVMNVFFVLEGRIVTPALGGTLLPGITRDSVIRLLRDMGHTVEERPIAIDEVFDAHRKGELLECFGSGTAAIVSHIRKIGWRDRTIELAPVETRTVGPAVRERLAAIASGRAPDPYGWVVPVAP